MSAMKWLENAWYGGQLDALEVMLAQHLSRMADDSEHSRDDVAWLSALLAWQYRQGHICLDLDQPPLRPFDLDCPWQVPDLETLCALNTNAIGTPDSAAPLVLDGHRLYLRRHWTAERDVADAVLARCVALPYSGEQVRQLGARVFPDTIEQWQKVAAINTAFHRFGIVTGGPGTGKTWTVTCMMALKIALAIDAGQPAPRIALAAPTGKAAARLSEAVRRATPGLQLADLERAAMPEQATTLHRLLGMNAEGRPRYHRDYPLPVDAVIVDEASMVDLGLMAQLVRALPADACLYLVGDRDQLASVQAGSVFADLCGEAENRFAKEHAQRLQQAGADGLDVSEDTPLMRNHVTRLRKVHRFGEGSGIARLAEAVRQGDDDDLAALRDTPGSDLEWLNADAESVLAIMLDNYLPLVGAAHAGTPAEELLQMLARFRALVPLRNGPEGCDALNEKVDQRIRQRLGLGANTWYPGKAIMLRHNDWHRKLFNGDLGITVRAPDGSLRVAFPMLDQPEQTDEQQAKKVRLVSPARLPDHELAWAMTIHKSQGSEFDSVLLALPREDLPLLTRELLYTGVTRAGTRLTLAADDAQLARALARPVWRASGLADRVTRP